MTMSMFDLSGQRILITGAAKGIGAATASLCASLGAELILVPGSLLPEDPLLGALLGAGLQVRRVRLSLD